jgi:uncharacterized protein (DUF433 family)
MSTRRHRSFRFDPATLERLERRAAEAGITRTALVERYVDEGLRRDDHPLIVFVDEAAGRRARLAGTGLDVWEVVGTVRDNGGSAAAAAAYHRLPEWWVHAALGYYADFPDEVDASIAANARIAEQEQARARRIADALG